jgi:hypothetical protein
MPTKERPMIFPETYSNNGRNKPNIGTNWRNNQVNSWLDIADSIRVED